jgi:hypothetical protein
MYELRDAGAAIVTDTLYCSINNEPMLFSAKAWVQPHLDLTIVCTGLGDVGNRWAAEVHDNFLCRDIDMLDLHAPDRLKSIWAEEIEGKPGTADKTATVYHFGYSEVRDHYVGYAYRSYKGLFRSDPMASGGFGMKPDDSNSEGRTPQSIDDFVSMAVEEREAQERRPAAERLYIGGDLVMVIMSDRKITIERIHRWEDFEDQWRAMCERLPGDASERYSVTSAEDGQGPP